MLAGNKVAGVETLKLAVPDTGFHGGQENNTPGHRALWSGITSLDN
jgi:hypothetical protein